MKSIVLAILISILFLFSCSLPTSDSEKYNFNLGDTLSLHYKVAYYNQETEITIKFDSLLNDSRCPVDLRCFWEGDAEVKLHFKKGSDRADFTLHTAAAYFNSDTLLYGNIIKLIDLQPYPHSEIFYDQRDYIVKLVVE